MMQTKSCNQFSVSLDLHVCQSVFLHETAAEQLNEFSPNIIHFIDTFQFLLKLEIIRGCLYKPDDGLQTETCIMVVMSRTIVTTDGVWIGE
jgi:hypothetical protein